MRLIDLFHPPLIPPPPGPTVVRSCDAKCMQSAKIEGSYLTLALDGTRLMPILFDAFWYSSKFFV